MVIRVQVDMETKICSQKVMKSWQLHLHSAKQQYDGIGVDYDDN